ncbi:MAG: hypothetical protein A2Y23_07540 [Clostridiales bacterium GWB2_37_7]|nr:MAG: hypothetical protein A2Y23_07540 [Clostridiales bacterium GWB2_37_7]
MNNYKKQLALVLVMAMIAWGLTACLPQPARRPVPNDTDNYRNNSNTNAPYTAQNFDKKTGNNNGEVQNQTSSLFSKLDYSFATITENIKVRSGSSSSTPIVASLKAGDEVKVIGKLNGWYVVNIPNTNKVGSISPNYAKLYSAQPGSTKPEPTKPIPTTPTEPTKTSGKTPTPERPPGTTTGSNTPASPAGTTPNTNTATAPTGTGTLSSQGSRILQLVNAERAKVGAPALKSNTDLNKLATMKSQDMVEKNYFSHQSPTYGSPFDMMKTYGVSYMYAGENLAINSDADKAQNAWMNSEGHRKNILNPDFTEIGIGLYPKGSGSYTYTQLFIGK